MAVKRCQKPKTPRISKASMKTIPVQKFFDEMKDRLRLRLVAGEKGLHRVIKVAELNRPGLGLAGYFEYFAKKRVQVLGKVEIMYMQSLSPQDRYKKVRQLFGENIPCVIVARNFVIPAEVVAVAKETSIPVFRSHLITMNLVNAATDYLEEQFAPSTMIHGTFLEVYGMGVLIRGRSGVGKSECALALIKRGHRLITDDVVKVHITEGRDLVGSGAALTRHHMEIRGLGIINVETLFGAGCVRDEKRLDLMITLEDWNSKKEYERLGLADKTTSILGLKVPSLVLPVRPGRDIALLVETASLNQRLKEMGYHSARELNRKLLESMEPK